MYSNKKSVLWFSFEKIVRNRKGKLFMFSRKNYSVVKDFPVGISQGLVLLLETVKNPPQFLLTVHGFLDSDWGLLRILITCKISGYPC